MTSGGLQRVLGWAVAIGACSSPALLAGDGPVKLQTGAPGCPDSSGNIYVDCGNGTVTDNRSGLVWLRDTTCFGEVVFSTAVAAVAGLSDLPGVT